MDTSFLYVLARFGAKWQHSSLLDAPEGQLQHRARSTKKPRPRLTTPAAILAHFHPLLCLAEAWCFNRLNPSPAEITAFAHELIKRDIEADIQPYQRLLFGAEATPDTEDYKKRDEQGRVILQLRGNTVYETHYNDRTDAKYEKSMSYWNLADKRTNKRRPDLVIWAESVRKKAEDTESSQKEDAHDQSG